MVRRIGVLALQGDFAEHKTALERAGAEAVEVRLPHQLEDLDGLISEIVVQLKQSMHFTPYERAESEESLYLIAKRLDALPHARYCIECKQREEDGKR